MKVNLSIRSTTVFVAMILAVLFVSTKAIAHCDTMDGPVVSAAKQALKTRNVNYVLIWVQQKDDPEVRQAFRQTLAVRKLNRAARDLADHYFFETLVRIHRAGEGQPYTGLKPAGSDLGPVIPVADKAIESGSITPLLKLFSNDLWGEIQGRFTDTISKKGFHRDDVEAGRKYVSAYTSFLEYIEHLQKEKGQGVLLR